MSALLTAGFGEPRNGSLPTAARSCVRGAARATVDKSPCSELPIQLWSRRRSAPDDLAEVQIGRLVEEWFAWYANGTNESPDFNSTRCASREPPDEHVEVLSIPLKVAGRGLAGLKFVNDEYRLRSGELSSPSDAAGDGRQQLVAQETKRR